MRRYLHCVGWNCFVANATTQGRQSAGLPYLLLVLAPGFFFSTMSALPLRFQHANQVVAGLLVLSNGYFLVLSYWLIRSEGGPMGYGWLGLPFLLVAHTLLVPAALTLPRQWRGSTRLFVFNLIGLLYSVGLLYFLLFKPGTP
ncbi:hypothetical protein KLP40_13705 [Hymenobacter sp. NST-14]|uniref:hypothetical protein n=1 Tax=Hymenobacter piscis TaxID=2839984 RepID=UPI001C03A234|nr:hypothetical protein [Hymenobacter piscis]MBT9394223.1 hypothetical protein [Hymenobacter piscis]